MLTEEAIVALAPDAASVKAARGLTSPAKWPVLGADTTAVWGACQGSGVQPYQTQVDLQGPAFKCSCPSRKFPCKHGLALLLLQAQSPERFAAGEPPGWVRDWLASRRERAEKASEKAADKLAEKLAEKASDSSVDKSADGTAAPETAASDDPATAAATIAPDTSNRKAQARWIKLRAAADDLNRWLHDQIQQGLGSLTPQSVAAWHTMAARMVDAQAAGLAQRVRDAAALIRQGEHWPERLLDQLGLLSLLTEALLRSETFGADDPMLAELRQHAGWAYDKADVLAAAMTEPASPRSRCDDLWLVLGVAIEERDDKLTERRVWLQGLRSGERAWLLEHSYGGRGFSQTWVTGQLQPLAIAWYPGTHRLRGLVIDQAGASVLPSEPASTADAGFNADIAGHGTTATRWLGSQTIGQEWQRIADRVAASPWVQLHPMLLPQARVVRDQQRPFAVIGDRWLPLTLDDTQLWLLLASSAGQPVQLFGEWQGDALLPLAAWAIVPDPNTAPDATTASTRQAPHLLWQRGSL